MPNIESISDLYSANILDVIVRNGDMSSELSGAGNVISI